MKNKLVPMSRAGDAPAMDLVCATVTGRAERWLFLAGADVSAGRALRAESCLIEPECGDTVLVCRNGAPGANTPAYVIAVLARVATDGAALVLPGGVALHAAQGALEVDAQSIRLNAAHDVTLQAPAVALQGVRGELAFERVDASVRETSARLGVVNLVAQRFTSSVGRLVQKARDSFRWIENVDETRAGRMRMKIDERLHVRAQHASVLADGHVKIDGEKIDLG